MPILLVADEPILRSAISEMLSGILGEITLCSAGTVAEAVRRLEERPHRLVLADFTTGDVIDGGALEQIASRVRDAPLIVLDRRVVPAHLNRARVAGAKAYIAKTASETLMGAAIHLAVAGGEYFPETVEAEPTSSEPEWIRRLSVRRRQVLDLLTQGKTNREIAQDLKIAVPTVKMHMHALMRASGSRNRTEVLLKARS